MRYAAQEHAAQPDEDTPLQKYMSLLNTVPPGPAEQCINFDSIVYLSGRFACSCATEDGTQADPQHIMLSVAPPPGNIQH